MNGWRVVSAGALCAVFALGCQRATAQGTEQGGTAQGTQQGGTAPAEQAPPAAGTATLAVPGAAMDREAIEETEKAAIEARGVEPEKGERVVLANVEFDGRLQRVEADKVEVRDPEGNLYEAQLEQGSKVVRNGQEVAADALRQGADVRASFDLVGDRFVVKELEQLGRARRQ